MERYVVLAASVVLFVLVTSGSGAPSGNDTAVATVGASTPTEETPSGSHLNLTSIILSVIQNAKAVNLFNFLPNPIHSSISLFKEIFHIAEELGPSLPKLLLQPFSLLKAVFPHFVALVLIAVTYIPTMVLPCKIIALLVSILGMFSNYWAVFDTSYLSLL
jgi:hypothetical protein